VADTAESLEADRAIFDPPLDHGIATAVKLLVDAGVETFESCQGGEGHAYPLPTIRFHGPPAEGFRAYAVAITHGLPVRTLARIWRVDYGELTGPWWEMTFHGPAAPS
jgi:hypothetical protein